MRVRPVRPNPSAFTIIELLVVIAIIALLIGLLFPTLAEARRAAQAAVSFSNLRQLTIAHCTYSVDNRDGLVNPFDAPAAAEMQVPTWAVLLGVDGGAAGPTFADNGYASLMFSAHWASLLMCSLEKGQFSAAIQFAPQDATVLSRFRRDHALIENPDFHGNLLDGQMWDGSYWISPAMWTRADVWTGTEAPNLAPGIAAGPGIWRHNRTDDCISPQAKVMLWERFDFTHSSRIVRAASGEGGREKYFPNWNNPGASPRFSTMDGSVMGVKTSAIRDAIDRDHSGGTLLSSLEPCGDWDIPDKALATYLMDEDHLENGGVSDPGKYPAYFWATRDGIRGRDVNR